MMFRTLDVMLASFSRHPHTARATGKWPITASKDQAEDRVEDPDSRNTLSESTAGESKHDSPRTSRAASKQRTSQSIASQSRRRQWRHEAEGGEATQRTEQEQILSRDREVPIPFHVNLPEVVHDQPGLEVPTQPLLLPADGPRWISIDPPSGEVFIASSQSSLRGSKSPIRTPQPQIRKSENLRFCFVADGTALLIWQEEGASCIIKICLPIEKEDCMRGQKLTLATQRRGSFPSKMRVVRVAGGSKTVAAVVFAQGSRFKLCYFDGNGRHDPQHEYIEKDCGQKPPVSLSVSRDDRRIAVGWGGVVEIYSVVNGGLGLTPMQAIELLGVSQLHLQTTNFSIDSTELVIASQVKENYPTLPNVHTSVHNISQDILERMDAPNRCQLQATPNAPGISGVFSLKNSVNCQSPQPPSLLLTTQCRGSYATLLVADSSRRHKVIVQKKPILAAAQGSGQGCESIFVFQSDCDQIWVLDVRDGICKSAGNFSDDPRGLGWRELKALSIFGEGIAQAFWWSRDGSFVLKRIPINGQEDPVDVENIGKLYLEIQSNG